MDHKKTYREQLLDVLTAVREGTLSPQEALQDFIAPPFVETASACVDTHRALRMGLPEVIYAPGKTVQQIVEVAEALCSEEQAVLVTRVESDVAEAVLEKIPEMTWHKASRLLWWHGPEKNLSGKGRIAVVCAGTADLPVAMEALETARFFGNEVFLVQDVGVAGLHRLLASTPALESARVIIAVAGMEGALASVVGGLVGKPVIAVPTSTGYGASFGGMAALLTMMNSCAANVTVVNIDNGFGAAYAATLINRL